MSTFDFRRAGLVVLLLCLASRPMAAQEPEVNVLVAKELAGAAGQEALLLTVEYGPGVSEQAHRHDAQAFVYMLEGSIVMQVKGQPPVTLKAGDSFYEGREDVHLVGRNASRSEPARFVVFLVKDKDAAVAVPAQ